MSRGVSKKTKYMTLSAVLAAMGVVLLSIGGVVEVLDLSMAALASFFCIFAVIELGGGYPWMIYAVTGILSVILMPQSLGGWIYILFFGYYPIVKEKLERLARALSTALKFVVFNVAITICALISYFLFFGELELLLNEFATLFGGIEIGGWLVLAIYAILNFVFIVYDIALTKLITLYLIRFRKKFKFLK